jgi:hypothetical protein
MAFDQGRGRTVLFGGGNQSPWSSAVFADTWEYDGVTWAQVSPATSPPARFRSAMVFDDARARTVLFGGSDASALAFSDTWEYDGVTWTRMSPTTSPPGRINHAMAYDRARGRTVVFGGLDAPGHPLVDTWEYDGTTWTQMQPPASPAYGSSYQWMVYDSVRARTVLFEDITASSTFPSWSATWEYDGSSWARSLTPPTPRREHRMAYDLPRGRTVLFGGTLVAGTYGFQHLVLLADTWEGDGTTWMQVNPATSPPARRAHAMTYDLFAGRTVLFGGYGGNGALADTWQYDGNAWTSMTSATSPPARYCHAMAYDLTRLRTVLFGGMDASNTLLADTWEHDGTGWTRMTPAVWPMARARHAMAFDFARYRTVLFGGTHTARLADTWEYDGTAWTQVTPAASPSARERHAMVYDLGRGRTVIFGGFDAGNAKLADTWEYDGAAWTPLTPVTSPPARIDHAMAYDFARGCAVLFGGNGSTQDLPDAWELTPAAAPTFTRHGKGCHGSAGTPSLDTTAGAVPGLGTTFPLCLTALPPHSGFAYLAFGFNLIHWNGVPLPVSLAPFGLPCDLWVAPAFGALLAARGSTATMSLAIPANPSLAGVTVGAQALSFDAAAPGGVGAVSNGAILRLY